MDIGSERKLADAFDRISSKFGPRVAIMEQKSGGIETVLGAKFDPNFGQTIMFGSGGIAVEKIKDLSFRLAPVSSMQAEQMILETKIGSLIADKFDLASLTEAIVNFSHLVTQNEEILEMDINPLKVFKESVLAQDVRAKIK